MVKTRMVNGWQMLDGERLHAFTYVDSAVMPAHNAIAVAIRYLTTPKHVEAVLSGLEKPEQIQFGLTIEAAKALRDQLSAAIAAMEIPTIKN